MAAARVALTVCVISVTVMMPSRPAGQGRDAALLTFDRYHGYEETAALLRAWAATYPKLARVYSIGKDLKGYDTLLLELTNQETGKAEEKPAFWADGNIDADEPSATEAILYLADRLLSQHGKDPEITRLVNGSTFYLVPMSNPYMAHLYVSTPMTGIVSSINSRPRDDDGDGRLDEDPPDDVDGDGQILQMRVRDPHGMFRTHPKDPRLMVRVKPDEAGEWTIYSEGFDNDGDGAINEDWIGGVDLNRNFPFDWQPEWIQEGAGPYPLSEPESRHLVEFIVAHPNIGFVLNGHSGPDDGLLYRPYGSRPDSAIPRQDYLTMGTFAEKFASLSGGLRMLPPYGAEAERRFGPGRQVYGHGFMLEWAYEMAGAFSFVAEHGIIPGDVDHNGRVSDEELIRVSDEEFGGKLFVNWKPFTHPTLGAVEIGGFVKFTKPNPPPGKYLERLVQIYGAMYQYWASTLPHLALRVATPRLSPPGHYVVTAVVSNEGLLPTNVTEKAIDNRYAGPVIATAVTSPNVEIVAGEARVTLGHLQGAGFQYRRALSSGLAADEVSSKSASWVVRTRDGAAGWIEVTAAAEKAGVARTRVSVGGTGRSQ
jgi:hypothetical protein